MSVSSIGERREGAVLLLSVLVAILVLALVAALVGLSVVDARSVAELEENERALLLAESGIASSQHELVTGTDPDADGVGNVLVTGSGWAFQVSVTSLGGGQWRISSQGMAGGASRTVEATARPAVVNAFPTAGISVLGDVDPTELSFAKHPGLIIDGGSSPAISLMTPAMAQLFGESFATAIHAGQMPLANLTGAGSQSYNVPGDPGAASYSLPIASDTDLTSTLDDLSVFYGDLVNVVNNTLIPSAFVPTGIDLTDLDANDTDFGTPSNPVTLYFPSKVTLDNGTITGAGTLIVGELDLPSGATLNWEGDVIVTGVTSNKAFLEVHGGGQINVTGNLVLLGEGSVGAMAKVKSGGYAQVTGSLFLGTNYQVASGQVATLQVDGNGTLDVHGILTAIGSKFVTSFKSGSDVLIDGTVQIALPSDPSQHQLLFDAVGNVEIHKNDTKIRAGLAAWESLVGGLQLTASSGLLVDADGLEVNGWKCVGP